MYNWPMHVNLYSTNILYICNLGVQYTVTAASYSATAYIVTVNSGTDLSSSQTTEHNNPL